MPDQLNTPSRPWRFTTWFIALVALSIGVLACGPGPGNGTSPPTGSVSIEVTVTGAGTVEAPGFDFSCRDTCTLVVEADAEVTLIAVPDAGQVAVAWDGPCGALDVRCQWIASQGGRAAMTFAPNALRFELIGDGQGRFDVQDGTTTAACRESCGVGFVEPRSVAVTYRSEGGNRTQVGPWTGACEAQTRTDYCLVDVEGAVEIGNTWLHPPIAQDEDYTALQAEVLDVSADAGLLVNASDTPDDVLRATIAPGSSPEHGTVTIDDDGAFTYEPNPMFSGSDAFAYRVVDAFGNHADAIARITVHPRLELTKLGAGAGRVSSEPDGIDCDAACRADHMHLESGDEVTLSADPDVGSVFDGWNGACEASGVSPTCTITITSDAEVMATVSASFTVARHRLTVDGAGTGAGNVISEPAGIDLDADDTSSTFDYGTEVTLSASAEEGSTFTGWTGDCSGTSTCTLIMTEDRSATATFAVNRHRLTVGATGTGSGNVTSVPAGIDLDADNTSSTFDYGTEVTLSASAAEGSTFTGWTGDCSASSGDTCAVIMDENKLVGARFEAKPQVVVTIEPSSGGTISADPAAPYVAGDVVTFTALADENYQHTAWGGACSESSAGAPCILTLSENTSVSATFGQQAELTITSSSGGRIEGDPPGLYLVGTDVSFTAVADDNHQHSAWGGACSGFEPEQQCTFTLTGDATVSATFSLVRHTVTSSIHGNGTVSSDPAGIDHDSGDASHPFAHGTRVTFTATPASGSSFYAWGGECRVFQSVPTCTIEVERELVVRATFD